MTERDVVDLFRRLKPIAGEKIDRLWQAYAAGNWKERQEIEELLHMMEVKTLRPTPDDQTLNLPPPPAAMGKGQFHLGATLFNGKPVGEFALPDTSVLRQHVSIFGRSGAGKTNLLFHLLDSLRTTGVPVWLYDWKRDYRSLLARRKDSDLVIFTLGRPIAPFAFNPLLPPPGSEGEIEAYHERLVDVIGSAFYVGEGVKSLLRKGLLAMTRAWRQNPVDNPLNFHVLLHWMEQYRPPQQTRGRRAADWTESTLRALESLCLGEFGKQINATRPLDLEKLMHRNVIFELDALAEDQKTFFVETLLLWLRQYLLNRAEEGDRLALRLVLVIEEAHHVLKTGHEEAKKESVLETTLRETRSLGMGLILVDQTPSLIDRVAFANTFTSVFFSLKGQEDIRAAAHALLLQRDQEEYLGRLPVGIALVKLQDGWFDPFVIRVPHIPDKDLPVRDAEVAERFRAVRGEFAGLSAESGPVRPPEEEWGPESPPPLPGKIETLSLSSIDLRFLQGILTDPLIGISRRYKELGMSTRHGNESQERLVRAGLVRAIELATATGHLKLLELTAEGTRALRDHGLLAGPPPQNGAQHRYWKEAIAVRFRQMGYEATIEKVVTDGKRVDVEVAKGDERIAIEVETDRSKTTSNFPLILLHYPRLIVFLTDEAARAKVEAALRLLPEAEMRRVAVWTPLDLQRAMAPDS